MNAPKELEHVEALAIQWNVLYLYSQRNQPKMALQWGLSKLVQFRTSANAFIAEFYHILLYFASLCGDEQCFSSLLEEMIENQLANTVSGCA